MTETASPPVASPSQALPKVSVCMLVYNHEAYLAQAIESVLAQQTDFDFELVIGEDCSIDRSRHIARGFAAQRPDRVRILERPANLGAARNYLNTMAQCRGEYMAFCEGDDFWQRRDKLALQVRVLDQRPDCSLVCCDYNELDMVTGALRTRVNARRHIDPAAIDDIRYINRGTPSSGIHTAAVMTRRRLVEHVVQNDPEFVHCRLDPGGDGPMWAALFKLGSIAYIPESLSTYRRSVESCTRNPSDAKVLRTSIRVKEQMLRQCEQHRVGAAEEQIHRRDIALRLMKLAFLERDPIMAREAKAKLGSLAFRERLYYAGAMGWGRPLVEAWRALFDRRLIPTAIRRRATQ